VLGGAREANYDVVPRAVHTDPQAAAVGATSGPLQGTARPAEITKTETYTRQADTIQPFPTFPEIHVEAPTALRRVAVPS
jgi:pyruvate/2-oxoglutarate dehydrogenase complex dihydrolipoamide dehydrogenase (E3) component